MKKKDLKEIRLKDTKEVEKLISKKKSDLLNLIIKSRGSGEKNVKKARNLRKDIAQILTVIHEKELNEEETKKIEAIEFARSQSIKSIEGIEKPKKAAKLKEMKLNK